MSAIMMKIIRYFSISHSIHQLMYKDVIKYLEAVLDSSVAQYHATTAFPDQGANI